jgi:hypothetical protein
MPLERRMREELRRMAADVEPDIEGRLEATLRSARRAATRQQLRDGLGFAAAILAVVLVGPPLIGALRSGSHGAGASPSPTQAAALTGTYATTLVPTDGAVTSNRMLGDWTIVFDSSGILTVTAPPEYIGTRDGYWFQATDSEFRTDLFGDDMCTTIPPGTYHWSLSGGRLTFTVVDDSCAGRVALYTAGVWFSVTAR